MFVSTNAIFLEYDYMTNYKLRSKVVIEELLSDKIIPQPTTVVQRQNEEATSIRQDHCLFVVVGGLLYLSLTTEKMVWHWLLLLILIH